MKFIGLTDAYVRKNSRGQILNRRGFNKRDTLTDVASIGVLGNTEHVGARGSAEVNITMENYRGHIALPWPSLNYITSNGGALLTTLLGMKQNKFKDIMSFNEFAIQYGSVLLETKETDTYNPETSLFGPEILLHKVEEMDLEHEIRKELEELSGDLAKYVHKRRNKKSPFIFEKGQGQFHLIGEWYVTMPDSIGQFYDQELVYKAVASTYGSGYTRLTYLLNMRNTEHFKEVLRGMFLHDIIVLPQALRVSFDGMTHQLTDQYAKLIGLIENVRHLQNFTLEERKANYSKMLRLVQEITEKTPQTKKDNRAIQELVTGKHGLIRGNMLGKRVDYSGRSVIAVRPDLSIDQAGIPDEILVKIMRPHLVNKLKGFKTYQEILNMSTEEAIGFIEDYGILEHVPVALNRAPSLHRLSFLAFMPVRSRSKSIEISPLVTTGFNADFDGDQMGVHAPLTEEAIREMKTLMLPSQNIYHPATGLSIIQPKMEMIYGLNFATREHPDKTPKTFKFNSAEEAYEALMKHQVDVWDIITAPGFEGIRAGRFGFEYCIPKKLREIKDVVTSKTISYYTAQLLAQYPSRQDIFVKTIDALVGYGFRMAKIYTPTISILDERFTDARLTEPLNKFEERIKDVTYMYNRGLEDDVTYRDIYSEELKKISDEIKDEIPGILGQDNGFLQLVQAGARGSVGNLQQIYSHKGQIQKTDYESFSAVIKSNFSGQLNPLEHFISAYGTRKGLIDKTQKTADTGYIGRLMYQAAADWVITNLDCGTREGFIVDKNYIANFIKIDDSTKRATAVSKFFYNIIKGRYGMDGQLIDAATAEKIANDNNVTRITIRSPLTCKEPCCVKCYGTDLSTNKIVTRGMPIGFVAGQAIGEPGTQLTMRTFQKGGVAGKADVTSNFDRMQNFLSLKDIREENNYDPIAWSSGPIVEEIVNDFKKIIKIGDHPREVSVPIDAYLKKEVTIGEGICEIQGDHNINEIIKYSDFRTAQRYLVLSMSTCYLDQADINSIHFEVLVASMSLHFVVDKGSSTLKEGLLYTQQRISQLGTQDVKYSSTLKSVKQLPLLKDSPLNRILMENFKKGISSSIALGLEDSFENNMSRMMVGMRPKLGTYYSNYINERGI